MYAFLAKSEAVLTASASETEKFVLDLYGGAFDFEPLTQWLRSNVSFESARPLEAGDPHTGE